MQLSNRSSMLAKNLVESPLGHISLAGFIRNGLGIPRRPLRVLGSYAVVYVVDGGGRWEDETGLVLDVRAGDLLVIFPEIGHTYGPVGSSQWTELYLVFDGPVFDVWRSTDLLNPAKPVYHLEPVEYWTSRFESVLGAPSQPGYAPSLVETCRLQLVLSEALIGSAKGGGQDEEAAWVARVCALLEPDVERDIPLHQLADDVNMSYDGFRKRFARQMGISPARYRSVRQIDRACELMQQGTLTDKQIAASLGFCDEFYFSRRFKQITGRTPRQFRARLPRLGWGQVQSRPQKTSEGWKG